MTSMSCLCSIRLAPEMQSRNDKCEEVSCIHTIPKLSIMYHSLKNNHDKKIIRYPKRLNLTKILVSGVMYIGCAVTRFFGYRNCYKTTISYRSCYNINSYLSCYKITSYRSCYKIISYRSCHKITSHRNCYRVTSYRNCNSVTVTGNRILTPAITHGTAFGPVLDFPVLSSTALPTRIQLLCIS